MPAAAPILIGAAIGAVSAKLSGGNMLKGALFGAVGGGIGYAMGPAASSITGAGNVAGDAASAGAADAVSSTTQQLAQSTVDSGVSSAAGSTVADAATQGATGAFDMGGLTGTGLETGMSAGPGTITEFTVGAGQGAASSLAGQAASPELIDQAMEWARKNPALASGVIQSGMSMVGGFGNAIGQERKAELELENRQKLLEYYKNFVQSGSAGGVGVNLGVHAPSAARPLQRPGGTPVFATQGLIARSV